MSGLKIGRVVVAVRLGPVHVNKSIISSVRGSSNGACVSAVESSPITFDRSYCHPAATLAIPA